MCGRCHSFLLYNAGTLRAAWLIESHCPSAWSTCLTAVSTCLFAATPHAVSIPQKHSLDASLTLSIAAIACLNSMESGGWALFRRIGQGSAWYSATDGLTGTASYGVGGARPTHTTSHSIPYHHLLSPNTQFMFTTGKRAECVGQTVKLTYNHAQGILANG